MKHDLNLLRVFDAVMEERNVTAAATRLGLSQSSVSAALARLRQAFGDELFIRVRYGVVPSEKALSIAPTIAQALGQIDQVLREAPVFDPATAERRFTLAASAYFECVLIPPLMTRSAKAAPKVSMVVQPLSPETESSDLASGRIDLALGRFVEPPENLVVAPLLEDDYLCLLRRKDAPPGKRLSKAQFETLDHVVVSPPGRWRSGLFQQLEGAGLSRRVRLTVSHFLAAPLAVIETGSCATLPRRIALLYGRDKRLCLLEPPRDLGRFPTQMAWHPRNRRDPGHTWLRRLIQEVCKGL